MNETTLIRPTEAAAPEATPAADRLPGPPRLGLMGEFSAGKTTLINFLLGEEILPTRVTATQMPPVWLSYGPRSAHYVTTDGAREDITFDAIGTIEVEGVRYVRVYCEAEILKDFDLIDTPGISDPNIPDAYRQAVVDFVDGVIWCTHAPQAWRESERSAWVAMPDRLFATSILLATRSDKLAEKDRARVQARLRHEAGGLFGEIIMFSTLDAIRACEMDGGDALFAASGAERLVAALHEVANGISDANGAASARAAEPASAVIVPLPPASVRPARVSRVGSAERQRLNPEDAGAMEQELRAAAVEPTPIRRRVEPAVEAPRADAPESAAPESAAPEAATVGAEVAPASDTGMLDADGIEEMAEDSLAGDQDMVALEEAEERAFAEAIELDASEAAEPVALEVGPAQEAEHGADGSEARREEDVLDLSAFRIEDEGTMPPAEDGEAAGEVDAGAFSTLLANIGRSVEEHEAQVAPRSVAAPLSARAIWEEIAGRDEVVTTTDLIAAIGDLLDRLERDGRIVAPQGAMDFGQGEG
ncbi:MAG: dynamin family protein [Paracoccaceae bacterium]